MCPDMPSSYKINGYFRGSVHAIRTCIALAGEDSKRSSHMRQHPGSVFVVLGKERYARQTDTLRDGLEWRLLLLVFGSRYELLGLLHRGSFNGDSGGCHCVCGLAVVSQEVSEIDQSIYACRMRFAYPTPACC
jgi:hypothetical protein